MRPPHNGRTASGARKRLAIQNLEKEHRRYESTRLWITRDENGRRRSYREIGEMLGISYQMVANDINAVMREMAEANGEVAVNVRQEFLEQLEFAKKLREAAREMLLDPDDPLGLTLVPQAHEIEVVYYDHNDLVEGNPKRKKAMLSTLLESLGATGLEADKFTVKHVDIRKFALDAIATTDVCIDRFAKLAGEYVQEKPNAQSVEKAIESYRLWSEKNPDATADERDDAIQTFAKGLKVDENALRAGVQEISAVQ